MRLIIFSKKLYVAHISLDGRSHWGKIKNGMTWFQPRSWGDTTNTLQNRIIG